VVEVDVVALEAGEFAPAAAGPGGGDDEQSCGWSAEHGGLVGDPDDVFGHGEDFLGAAVILLVAIGAGLGAGLFGGPLAGWGVGVATTALLYRIVGT
jgi:hypothetical protein